VLLWPVLAAGAPPAGKVLFAIGDARLQRSGEAFPLAKGDAVRPGDRLVTSASGHVHLRMADEAFVSLRPNSALAIQAYHYDPDHPEKNRVKFELRRGVMRSVTGEAGRTNKDGFRVNTPVAAIGIRGTDFTVYTSRNRSRAQVYSGGITVSPFTPGCQRQGSGACRGGGAATLRAAEAQNRVLEVTARDEAARILKGKAAGVVPSRSETEPEPSGEEAEAGAAAESAASPRPVDDVPADVKEQETVNPALAQAANREHREQPPEAWQVTWGRWSAFTEEGEASVLQQKAPDQEIGAVNTVFALLQPARESFRIPQAGVARFRPGPAEAYIKEGAELSPAQVENAHLTVDFAKRLFQTNLDITAESLAGAAHVDAAGVVRGDGLFLSDPQSSNGHVQGVLTPDLREAGMLFQRELSEERMASGAIHWFRPAE
jgi:hypothetical protein